MCVCVFNSFVHRVCLRACMCSWLNFTPCAYVCVYVHVCLCLSLCLSLSFSVCVHNSIIHRVCMRMRMCVSLSFSLSPSFSLCKYIQSIYLSKVFRILYSIFNSFFSNSTQHEYIVHIIHFENFENFKKILLGRDQMKKKKLCGRFYSTTYYSAQYPNMVFIVFF